MNANRRRPVVLIVEDDEDDRVLIWEALEECQLAVDARFVKDGEETMDYLRRRGRYGKRVHAPCPALILLDLKMPKKGGYEVIEEVRADTDLQKIPIIVLTTSKTEEDVQRSYALGANSYIAKPDDFKRLINVIKVLGKYWFGVVALPKNTGERLRSS